jgi:hypothetical protein
LVWFERDGRRGRREILDRDERRGVRKVLQRQRAREEGPENFRTSK